MKIAYLMNTYPITSTTFIRREIDAHERAGMAITRYAMRPWDGELVDPDDLKEKEQTHYILTGNAYSLVKAFLRELLTNPKGVTRAIAPWLSLIHQARGGILRHVAYLLEAIYFRQETAKHGIEHVHTHFMTNACTVAMLAHLMGGPSYSATAHGPDELTDAPLLGFTAKIEHANFIAAITHFCKSQLIRFSKARYEDKIKIIHCALNLRDFAITPPPDNQTIVCVGRLCPQKGQALLPKAAAALSQEFPDLKIVLIGDGHTRSEIQQEIQSLGLEKHFVLAGWKSNLEVREAITKARCFMLASFAEGLPVGIMEAFALGRPVISTYIAGIPELVDEECGWIVPAGSIDDLAHAIKQALTTSPEKLVALGKEGRRRVELAHDIDTEALRLRKLFSTSN